MSNSTLLQVIDLYVNYRVVRKFTDITSRVRSAVAGVNFTLSEGETLGVVGGSGSGKTTLLKTIVGVLKPSKGEVIYRGVNVHNAKGELKKKIMAEIGYVPQEPSQSLDPRMKISSSVTEPLRALGVGKSDRYERARYILKVVGLSEEVLELYPRDLSIGMLQRVAIARALITKPKLVLLDEPTSSLDISTQAQILNFLREMKEVFNLSYIIVTHDISVASYLSERLAVMSHGTTIEEGSVDEVLNEPLHPYTRVLIEASKLKEIEESLEEASAGCPFINLCTFKTDVCFKKPPPQIAIGMRRVKCWRYSSK
ncbi:MAG: ABC transporter ATP-binding protein [Sulfolobales archaeon]|nr:ABC transporter ATP-binding protein [Sulfolobales archaeon]MCX8198918.1 ABC transporter ATP-binding protein [Sulfolobales archaeon]MDW8169896.1 ABC transporter ATP-binding protein [Desulfurococcaceae archaeon]